jgi:hypothetical protein
MISIGGEPFAPPGRCMLGWWAFRPTPCIVLLQPMQDVSRLAFRPSCFWFVMCVFDGSVLDSCLHIRLDEGLARMNWKHACFTSSCHDQSQAPALRSLEAQCINAPTHSWSSRVGRRAVRFSSWTSAQAWLLFWGPQHGPKFKTQPVSTNCRWTPVPSFSWAGIWPPFLDPSVLRTAIIACRAAAQSGSSCWLV